MLAEIAALAKPGSWKFLMVAARTGAQALRFSG